MSATKLISMRPSALHLLLTYQCNYSCEHCFVWGSPRQSGTLRLADTQEILRQAEGLGSVEWIYFEGGEPFLYHPILLYGVREAASAGFRVGVVTNAYWATGAEEAEIWLQPMAGLIEDLSVSDDLYHSDDPSDRRADHAVEAAARLGIPTGTITVAQPGEEDDSMDPVMFRGRAAVELAHTAPQHRWDTFDACPYENLRDPGRIHIDPLGHAHVCQGISLGNLFSFPLEELCADWDPERHPIVGPLLRGGPAELARHHSVPHRSSYADACELCYQTRVALRARFPDTLAPDQMYGPKGDC